jgi:hypothetical protein
MDTRLLTNYLINPALLLFGLGVLAKVLKGDLEIPARVSEFIPVYLLFSISYKGGQLLARGNSTVESISAIGFGLLHLFHPQKKAGMRTRVAPHGTQFN